MKTFYKILLLILFSVGAVAGVLVFAKTQVAPPMNIDPVDQYVEDLKSDCDSYEGSNDYQESQSEYVRLDNKLKRFIAEDVITSETSDEYRHQIDEIYGKDLCRYGFRFFQRNEWPDKDIKELSERIAALRADKLSTGETAVTGEFITQSDNINNIIAKYSDARQLARNTSFTSVDNSRSKINRADEFTSDDYLKNNRSLVADLNSLRGKLARSHYNYVASKVNQLAGKHYLSEDEFLSLLQNVNVVIDEYKNT
ncbi:MAG: hypothetical protein K2K82_06430, partial [Muribaculaceae bacterium]|nr:hypothetical protein [Muribaculaceae bacterium]